jgi:fluoroquinolone transport system permease protein
MIKRLFSTFVCDVVIQFRNGFYYVSAFFILVWVAILQLLPDDSRLNMSLIVPAFMMLNLLITTFYFIGALVLLEKSERTLTGLVLTPLRDYEYLTAKIASLTLLAIMETALIIGFVFGVDFAWLPLLAGMIVLGAIYTLLGFVAIARYHSINEYLLPSGLIVTALMLPLLDHFGLWQSLLFYLHPVQPPLILMRSAFVAVESWQMAYAVIGSLVWFALSFGWAHRIFYRFVVRTAGG